MDSNTIRNIFIDFFKNKSHNFVESSQLVMNLLKKMCQSAN